MASGVLPKSEIAELALLQDQADAAAAHVITAQKAVTAFAEKIKNDRTPENITKLNQLIAHTELALAHSETIRRKLFDMQLATLELNFPRGSISSSTCATSTPAPLIEKQVTPLPAAPKQNRWAGRTRQSS